MDVPVELCRIIISETSAEQYIFLKEKGGGRSFPIAIGISEALAIDRRLKGVEMARPMTHDLLAGVISAMGGRVQRVVINDLRDRAFIASLFIERDGTVIEVDARPSDAIALGVGLQTPVFVADHVLEKVLHEPLDLEDLAGQRENLEHRRAELTQQILKVTVRLKSKDFCQTIGQEKVRSLQHQLKEMQTQLEAVEEILRHLP
jgi:bifunctional DNase/RNase